MGAGGGEAGRAVVPGWPESVLVRLELHDRATQQPGVGEPPAQPPGDGTEILADDDAAGARRLDTHQGEQRLQRVAHVASGRAGLRDPEAAIEAQDMIDPDDPGMGHGGTQHPDEGPVGRGAEPRWD